MADPADSDASQATGLDGGTTRQATFGADAPHLTRGFLFADLRGYTDYVERHGDHVAAQLLERYRALVRGIVAASQGAEVKTEGDSFYVVFDSASAAVRAGQEIIAAADASDPEDPIRVGIGIHAGETVETAEGFVGSAVNIAARLCGQAHAGELVVSDTVRALTRTYLSVDFEPLGARKLKGVNEPIAIYRVVSRGGRSLATSAVASGRRRATRAVAALVGIVALLMIATAAGALLRSGPSAAPGSGSQGSDVGAASPSGFAAAASPSVSPAAASPGAAASALACGPHPDWTDDENALCARIPLDLETGCQRSSAPDGALGGVAMLRCELVPGSKGYGADTVWYDQFAQPGPMITGVNEVIAGNKLAQAPPARDCRSGGAQAIGTWSLQVTYDGQLGCYSDADGAWVIWTYRGDRIAVRAVRHDGDAEALLTWWQVYSSLLRY